MFRILELVGLLAPIAGIILLVIYRRRATAGAAWGIAGCIVALLGSAVGFAGVRLAAVSSHSGGDFGDLLAGWTFARFIAAILALALLLIGVSAGRTRADRTPSASTVGSDHPSSGLRTLLTLAGVALTVFGVALQFTPVDFGTEHEGLNEIVGMLVEAAEFGLLGAGLLALCVTIVTDRPRVDSMHDPVEVVKRSATTAHRLYRQFNERRG